MAWAPDKDLVMIPAASVVPLDPSSSPPGMTHKVIIDATTPVPPDVRGEFSEPVLAPPGTDRWERILRELLGGRS